jgi:hypothetical protein
VGDVSRKRHFRPGLFAVRSYSSQRRITPSSPAAQPDRGDVKTTEFKSTLTPLTCSRYRHGGAEDERNWHPHGTGRGSQRGGVAMILRSALLQTLRGLAIGAPVAFYGVTLVKSQLYELTTVSSSALAVAVGILLAAACVAGVIPARRAASVDPVRALRTE